MLGKKKNGFKLNHLYKIKKELLVVKMIIKKLVDLQ